MIPDRARPVLDAVAPLAATFAEAGNRLYLVGGAVRDIVINRPLSDSNDIDLTTDALPKKVKELVASTATSVWSQGERFGTIGCVINGVTFEITTHRAESYRPDSRKPEVRFSDDIVADLSRRDFTVNAMALEVTSAEPELIDPFGGLADLTALVLRTPIGAAESFSDDPLRMMRAARFIAGFGLAPVDELLEAVHAMSDRLEIVSPERIRDELCKLVVVDDPSAGLWFLNDSGLAGYFLPELPAMRLEQDPIHRHKDVLTHTIAVVAKAPNRLRVRLAALFHDIAKPKTRSIGSNGVSFHHHEVVGARMTRDRMRALRFSNEMIDDVSQLVFLHLRFHTYEMGWTDSAVRRFVRDAGPLLADLISLTRSDCTTRNRRKAAALDARIDDLVDRIDELRSAEEMAAIRPDLDGAQIMEHLGVGPGPVVGRALRYLLEVRLDEGPLTSEEAFERLDDWWAAQATT